MKNTTIIVIYLITVLVIQICIRSRQSISGVSFVTRRTASVSPASTRSMFDQRTLYVRRAATVHIVEWKKACAHVTSNDHARIVFVSSTNWLTISSTSPDTDLIYRITVRIWTFFQRVTSSTHFSCGGNSVSHVYRNEDNDTQECMIHHAHVFTELWYGIFSSHVRLILYTLAIIYRRTYRVRYQTIHMISNPM
jgi:hypothetical protein